jgi:hypothetical protein
MMVRFLLKVFFLSTFLLLSVVSPSGAQISITDTEYPTGIGWTVEYYSGGPHDFGFPLPGTSPWDYTSGPTDETETRTVIGKTGAIYSDSFPGANFAIRTVYLISSDTQYTFLSKTPSSLLEYGFSVKTAGDSFVSVYDDPLKALEFPLDFGNTWSDTINYLFFGIPITHELSFNVAAFGTLSVPAFSSLPCLVLRIQNITTVFGLTDTTWSYSWLVENWGNGAVATSNTNNPNFSIASSFERIKGQVGVEEEKSEYRIPNIEFRLNQNTPNPFSKLTAISYQIPNSYPASRISPASPSGRNHVSLKIYDITGRLVYVLVDDLQEPGLYQLPISNNQLPGSGIYFYRLVSGELAETRKMVVLR